MMDVEDTGLEALHSATLKSEWYRIVGLVVLLCALLGYAVARGVVVGQFRLLWVQTVVLLLVVAHEIYLLRAVQKELRHEQEIPAAMWAVNVLVESQLPTFALFLLLASAWMNPYQVLVAPAMAVYFLFTILSTLRLSPGLTIFSGLMSALGYLALTFYIDEKFRGSRAALGAFPLSIYVVYACLIFSAGIIAAVVAWQIQGYVRAALREAELDSKLKAVNHDLEIARSIQQGLLPTQAPRMDDFELAGWNKPADQTGGDYFDWQTLPDGRVAISLADATGHGIGPALVSSSCRAYSRAGLVAGAEKNGFLDRLNRLLENDLSANQFVTFVVVFLDPVTSMVKVLSAGHGPILWYHHAQEQIESLAAQGIPLGMIAGVSYEQGTEGQLDPGDILVLITDGFYEWENPEGEEFGLARLEAVIKESRHLSAEQIIEALRAAVMSFCRGTRQMDDLTAVVLKRRPTAS